MPRGFLCAGMPVCRALSASFVPADFHNLCPRCYWHGTPHVVLPVPGGEGCLFQNGGCLLLMGSQPPLGGVGLGHEWVGGFEGGDYIAKGARQIFPVIFSLLLVSR